MNADKMENENNHEMEVEQQPDDDSLDNEKQVYIPGVSRALKDGEELAFDPEAYKIFYSFETKWSCLSFDIVQDSLGDRSDFPLECYVVAGTQADKPKNNEIVVMGLKNLNTLEDEEDIDEQSDEDSDSEDEKKNAVIHSVTISHYGGINRVKVQKLGDGIVCAVWNDMGKVQLWNVTNALNECSKMTADSKDEKQTQEKPLFSYSTKREGYALGWSKLKQGDFASGDQCRNIHVYRMHEGGTWAVDQRALTGHSGKLIGAAANITNSKFSEISSLGSVEDVHWSPTEEGLLASCSCDGTIKLWDTRSSPANACVCTVDEAHSSDVNVLSWNPSDALLVSGGDDAELKIWSLKSIQFGQPVARFKYHSAPITSVEWLPQDATTFMASAEDDQVTIWDIATEADSQDAVEGVPPQLMFLHLGQKEVKEVHWHPQISGLALTTSLDGFNVFKTINI
ncbi:WD domain, G-beta repeat protein [Necator americanus]|uniref:Glutamate-rich WD repeat-containing protein 1 n=1 Tax=Necator americanus TaxID=51031 RepID=W2TG85_NECAM|nr:WD domain, G-beta repeat protein [Necator americanus]ETN80823.1 WD domain, G-beta repeat protein [Necator americanus]